MESPKAHSNLLPLAEVFFDELWKNYLYPLREFVRKNELIQIVPGFLVCPETVIVYVGRTHIAVEYVGPEVANEVSEKGSLCLQVFDYAREGDADLLQMIVGFSGDSTISFNMPMPELSEDLVLPTNRGIDKLMELGWNFAAQNSLMAFNMPLPTPTVGQFSRMVNSLFFDANESGLQTRHIKWIDFYPITVQSYNSEIESFGFNIKWLGELVESDARFQYPLPKDYKFNKLPKINRFIELWGNSATSEPEITRHLSKPENQFILTMRFGATEIHSELVCEWQSENKDNIKPDFFIVQSNGFADIVEFKLPKLDKSPIVGRRNREAFASWLCSYIAQTRVYSTYFDDPNNRRWFEQRYGFKVHKPKRKLVVGRRSDFPSDVWREIVHDYHDLEILTFDDLVDGVVAQFYK
jgi:hypothetical protein